MQPNLPQTHTYPAFSVQNTGSPATWDEMVTDHTYLCMWDEMARDHTYSYPSVVRWWLTTHTSLCIALFILLLSIIYNTKYIKLLRKWYFRCTHVMHSCSVLYTAILYVCIYTLGHLKLHLYIYIYTYIHPHKVSTIMLQQPRHASRSKWNNYKTTIDKFPSAYNYWPLNSGQV